MQRHHQIEVNAAVAITSKHKPRRRARRATATGHGVLCPPPIDWLPAMQIALDATAMTTYLAPRLAPIARPGATWTVTGLELLDYKPGQRGLIRY